MASQTLRHSSAVGIHLWQSLKTGKDSGKLSLQTGNLSGNLWTFIQPISEYFSKKSDGLPKEKIKAEFESKSQKKQRQ